MNKILVKLLKSLGMAIISIAAVLLALWIFDLMVKFFGPPVILFLLIIVMITAIYYNTMFDD